MSQTALAQSAVVAQKKTELGITTNPTPQQLDTLLRAVAGEVGGGLLVKTSGNNCLGHACDIICFSDGRMYDVLSDSEGAAIPSWNPTPSNGSACDLIPKTPKPPILVVDPNPNTPGAMLEVEKRLANIEVNLQQNNLRIAALESKGPVTAPPTGQDPEIEAVLREQLANSKAILALLQLVASKFAIK